MFQSARLKLTAWYLIIVMLISILFSVFIYNIMGHELDRGFRRLSIESQIGRVEGIVIVPRAALLTPGYLENAERRILINLVYINLGIFVLSAGAGYFLAGRTLRPIKEMVDEQNRFIADASHELRTPLTAMKTEIEVALRDKMISFDETKNILQSNLEEINNMKSLSDNLLRLAQFQKNGDSVPITVIAVKDIIDDAWKKVASLAKEKKMQLIFSPTKSYSVKGDKASLTELFVILFDNAIKYSAEESKIEVSVHKTDSKVRVKVKDHGIGIPGEDLPHIFDRFYRVEKSRSKTEIAGYGLGLSIAKEIVQEHNGLINAESTHGKGTVFTVQLPLV